MRGFKRRLQPAAETSHGRQPRQLKEQEVAPKGLGGAAERRASLSGILCHELAQPGGLLPVQELAHQRLHFGVTLRQ